ncbi:MAG: phytoene/squalene synthase family protein [Marinirhabdus sp.]
MKKLFDIVSATCSKKVTHTYSTSFSLATRMFSPRIRQHIYNIYGFVRFADEIVDSFHDYDKQTLFERFTTDLDNALVEKISLNPIVNSFQHTVHTYKIDGHLIESFLKSMRSDLQKKEYRTREEYEAYIYGSADVVGLMCLKVFVNGNVEKYNKLKKGAMSLGSGFQKINFLRDLKADFEGLSRTYFPNTNLDALDENAKRRIITEIEEDLKKGYAGILQLPPEAKFGVFMAYRYYRKLLKKLSKTPASDIKDTRIRVPNYQKFGLLTRSYVKYQLKLVR